MTKRAWSWWQEFEGVERSTWALLCSGQGMEVYHNSSLETIKYGAARNVQ